MILVGSNVPMYLVGAAHPRKADAQRLLERLATRNRRLVSDAEVTSPPATPFTSR